MNTWLICFVYNAANMSRMDTIDVFDDEGDEEIGSVTDKPTVASGSQTTKATKAAKGKAHNKLKPQTGNIKKRQRKLTSPVWDYFKILDEPDENGNLVCLCNRCEAKYIADSSHGTEKTAPF